MAKLVEHPGLDLTQGFEFEPCTGLHAGCSGLKMRVFFFFPSIPHFPSGYFFGPQIFKAEGQRAHLL